MKWTNLFSAVFIVFLAISNSYNCFGQINVTNTNIANVMAAKLAGPGVTIINASMQCNTNQSGIFTATGSNLGIDSGIVLTTGIASTLGLVSGVNGSQANFANANQGTSGDASLTALAGIATYDKCILEFDFKADGDSINFQYVFGSEEYPAFNCSNYNDVFGFFISGPGYSTPQNIALIPNTSIPVAINSVNNGVISSGGSLSNCSAMGAGSPFTSYYVNNTGGTTLAYDGFTALFTSKAAIQQCNTYHLKLAIADGFDHIFDSGVFLKAGSLQSNSVKLTVQTDSINAGFPFLYEGCTPGTVKIHRKLIQTVANTDTIQLLISGTATNGVDFPAIASTYIFSNTLSDSVKTISIAPPNDFITEGIETLKLILVDKCNTHVDSVTIQIKDAPKFKISNNDTTICQASSVQINGNFDIDLSYNWLPAVGVSNPTSPIPLLSPIINTTYILTGTHVGCATLTDTININVLPAPSISTTPTSLLCNGLTNGSILCTGTATTFPLTFTLSPGLINQTGSPTTYANLTAGVYTVTIKSGAGCTKTSLATITQPNALVWSNVLPINISCNSSNVGQINATVSGGTGTKTYSLQPGNVSNTTGNFTSLSGGTYTVTATDINFCSLSTIVAINQIASLNWTAFAKTNITCNGFANGILNSTAFGGSGIITYNLTPGNISNTTGNYTGLNVGGYTVIAADASGCTASSVFSITQPSALTANTTSTSLLCAGSGTGAITTIGNGGTQPITFTMIPGALSNTTGSFTNLSAGNYTVNITDTNGCNVTNTAILTQPPPIIYTNIVKVHPTCLATTAGSITVFNSGGVPSYTFSINGGAYQSSSTFANLPAGSYMITAKDANGCTSTYVTFLTVTNAPNLANTSLPIVCNTTTTQLNLMATSGTPPYTYTLLPGSITNTTGSFGTVTAGTYTASVVDANGCSKSIVVIIGLPLPLNWQVFTKNHVPCNATNGGNITCVATNGTPVYSYNMMPGNITNTTGIFPNLNPNTYTITVTDANNCTLSSIAVINQLLPLVFNAPIVTNVSCNGSNTGAVTLTTTGGTGTKTFSISPGGTTNTTGIFSNLIGGNYTISVADAFNCSNTTQVIISQPTPLNLNSPTLTAPNCVPGGNGIINITASGGVASYSYKLNTGSYQTSGIFSNLNISTYTITVKDANNCTKTSIVNLTNPNSMSFSSVTVTQSNCVGGSTGSIQASSIGGVGPISYNIIPSNITNSTGSFPSLTSNTYTVKATDAGGCSITSIATILQASNITWTSTSLFNITCHNQNNGQIQVIAGGGVGTLNYNLMPTSNSNVFGNFGSLVGNNYTVTATDANGCSISSIFNVVNPPAVQWTSVASNNVICNNTTSGAINVNATGGTGSLNYLLTPTNINNGTGNFPALSNNNYSVSVSDANGCSITSAFNITQPPPFGITSVSNTIPTCIPANTGSITVTASGGVSPFLYNLNSNPAQTANVFNGIGLSTYTITVTDAVGCSKTSSISITNPNAPNIVNVISQNILCFGNTNGTISTTVSGGSGVLSYNLQPNNISNTTGNYSNLSANSFTVSVTDASGCSATSNVLITQPPLLIWDSVNNRDISCYGGSNGLVTSSASGGSGTITYTLLPSGNSNTIGAFLGLTVGSYTLTATDLNGCVISSVFLINQAPPIVWNSVTSTTPSCVGISNGTINAIASGGVSGFVYKILPQNISNSSGSFTNLAAGIYTITVKDLNSCTLSTVVTINLPPPILLTNATTTFASCSPGCDGSVTLTATGGFGNFTYLLNAATLYQSSNIFTGLCTGVYTVTIKDGGNCTGTGTFSISTANGPNAITSSISNVSCATGTNGSATINATGGTGIMSYNFMPGNITNTNGIFSTLSFGTYSVVASDANGCTISTSIIVTQPSPITLSIPSVSNPSCFGGNNGTASVIANGGTGIINYAILPIGLNNTLGSFTGLSANTFTIVATDANNCSISTTATIAQPLPVSITLDSTKQVSCNGGNDGKIFVTAAGGNGSFNYTILPSGAINALGDFSLLAIGTYTIIATDINNCTGTITANISQPTQLNITQVSTTTPSCNPGGDAVMTINATGGTTTYSYSINGTTFQSSNIISNLSLGNYTVVVKDANGCTVSSLANVTNSASPIITNISSTLASCNPGCDANLTVTSSNGTGVHQYSANGGASQSATLFTNLCANTFTVIVTDAVGCTSSSVSTIGTVASPVISNVSSTNALCNGATNGIATIVASGGTGIINYVLTPGNISNTTGSFNNLQANLYTVVGTDANGCTLSTNVNITQPTLVTISNPIVSNVICAFGSSGGITVTANGGTGSFIYNIQPTNTNNNTGIFASLSTNTYTITATDANNCSITTVANVLEPNPITLSLDTVINVSCFGGNSGTINVSTIGGTAPFTYLIQPTASTNTTGIFNNLSVGVYSILSTDANGCTGTISVTLTQPTQLAINQITSTTPTCNPGGDAVMTILASGATPSYQYSINGGAFQNANIISNLSLGTYTIVVKDANGCTVSSTSIISNSAAPIITGISTTQASCNPGCDATLAVTSSNGTGAHQYAINGGSYQSNTIFNSICANNYTVTVIDAVGCTSSSLATITTIAGPMLTNVSTTNVSCFSGNNGTISLNVIGGTGIINYNLMPGNISNTTAVFNNLAANTYSIIGTDANGCTISTSAIIAQPSKLDIDTITSTPVLCYLDANGTISAPTSGGTAPLIFSISPSGNSVGGGLFTGLVGNTTYTIFVTDANGCSQTTTMFMNQPDEIIINSLINAPVNCFGQSNGTVTAIASGGTGLLQYSLMPVNVNNSTGQFNNLAGNIYTITVADSNGCFKSSTTNLFEPPNLFISSATSNNIICFGQINGMINVQALGGMPTLSYNLQPTNSTNTTGVFDSLIANQYTVTVTDINGCTTSVTQNVAEPTQLLFTSITKQNVKCFGQSNGNINVNASGGIGSITYTLMPGNMINTSGAFNGLPMNTYTITAQDLNNCSVDTIVQITQPQALLLTLDSTKNVTCHGGNNGLIATTASGGTLNYLFTLSPGFNSLSGYYAAVSAGIYTMIIADANGCQDSISSINISQPPAIQFTSVTHEDLTCYSSKSGSITVTAIGGTGNLVYSISPVTLFPQNPAGHFDSLVGGVYIVTVTDANNCTITTSVTVLNYLLLASSVNIVEPTCHGDANGSLTLTAIGGSTPLTFSLNNGPFVNSGIFANLISGTYTISIKDSKNCTADTIINLLEPNKVGAFVYLEDAKCNTLDDGIIQANGTGGRFGYTYLLTPQGGSNSTGFYDKLKVGNYNLNVKDIAGCAYDTALTIQPPANPLRMGVTKNDIACLGTGNEGWAKAHPVGGKEPYTYAWSTNPVQTNDLIEHLVAGYYTVVVIDSNGCDVKGAVEIEPGPCCTEIFIPTAFSPNNDGVNDVWKMTTATGISIQQFEVYDRWGNRVWQSKDPKASWDGSYKNKPMDVETYFYILIYNCISDGNKYIKKGDFLLVK